MCLGIPGRVVETWRDHEILMGKVDFDGVVKKVCLEHVPDVTPGEFVLVHVGFALSAIDETEAKKVFAFLNGMEQLEELYVPSYDEPGGPSGPGSDGGPGGDGR